MARLAGHTLAGQALLRLNHMNDAKNEFSTAESRVGSFASTNGGGASLSGGAPGGDSASRKHEQSSGRNLLDVERGILSMPGPDVERGHFQLETIAQAARDAGDWELAGFTARNMMEHNPNYAGGYYAMALVAQHQRDQTAAARLFESAQKLWMRADADLPETATIRGKTTNRSTPHPKRKPASVKRMRARACN